MTPMPAAVARSQPTPRILVVDDEPRIVSFVSRALASRGFQVDKAGTIGRARNLARMQRYGLIVLDLRMPDGDGVDLLRELVAEQPDVRVLVLSAVGDVDTRVRCLRVGAADYLSKPFSITELVARVNARLRDPSHGAAEKELRVGPVHLNVMTRRASGPAGTVALSEREFLLLRYLMQLQGDIATREELLQDIWGIGFESSSSNVVEVYVGRLRSKLGSEVIETVRNVGYRIEP